MFITAIYINELNQIRYKCKYNNYYLKKIVCKIIVGIPLSYVMMTENNVDKWYQFKKNTLKSIAFRTYLYIHLTVNCIIKEKNL